MDIRLLLIEIAEKIGLVATAALLSVLVPALRNRLLGVRGQPRDRLAALVLGVLLAMWGAKMGVSWLGVHINVHLVGVMMAAILGGFRVGLIAGVLSGLFYVYRVEESLGILGVVATSLDGALAGLVAEKRPRWVQGWRTFFVASGLQIFRFVLLLIVLAVRGDQVEPYLAGWPAHLVQLSASAAGITIFVVVARVVIAREDAAIALVAAQAEADRASLEALRRRLEPHFLFNALNTLRATIRRDPDQARELVLDLADMYRYLLHHPEDAPLADEFEHAQAYLAIETARLGAGRLTTHTELAPEVARTCVPALLLQPLVENAVKHGVAAHEGAGTVWIRGFRDKGALLIAVDDESEGEHLGAPEKGSGVALATLRQRLTQRYGEDAVLELQPRERGMRALVRIPWERLGSPNR